MEQTSDPCEQNELALDEQSMSEVNGGGSVVNPDPFYRTENEDGGLLAEYVPLLERNFPKRAQSADLGEDQIKKALDDALARALHQYGQQLG